MGDAPPSVVREPCQYARLRWAGEDWKKGGGSERPSVPDMCMLSKGMQRSGQDLKVDTAPGTGQKSSSCGLMIRAASIRLDLPHLRVKLHKAIISMHEIARCKEGWLPVSILPCQKAGQTPQVVERHVAVRPNHSNSYRSTRSFPPLERRPIILRVETGSP